MHTVINAKKDIAEILNKNYHMTYSISVMNAPYFQKKANF